MTCVYKEYEIRIRMVQEQCLQLKIKFRLRYNMKIGWWGDSQTKSYPNPRINN